MNYFNDRFSIFPRGWWNEAKGKVDMRQHPQQTQTISWIHEYITSERAKWATEEFRKMLPIATKEESGKFKVLNFEYATFSGTFSYRNAKSLIARTPFLTLDIDHLSSLEEARELQKRFIEDPEVETALCFVSPSGLGVKWIIVLPPWVENLSFKEQFSRMRDYVGFNYGIDPDTSGSDVCRACFLPWDEECYINPKYV